LNAICSGLFRSIQKRCKIRRTRRPTLISGHRCWFSGLTSWSTFY